MFNLYCLAVNARPASRGELNTFPLYAGSAFSLDDKQNMGTDAIGIQCQLFHFMRHPEQLGDMLEYRRILQQVLHLLAEMKDST